MRKLLTGTLILILIAAVQPLAAQTELSPDLTKMQETAQDYLNRGDYDNAIMMYHQAIRLAPGNVALRRDLAYTYFLAGNPSKAKSTIDPVLASESADEQTYQVASAIENVLGNGKKAHRIINEGLNKFPNSGLLFNSKGNLYMADKKAKNALKSWNDGINAAPSLPINYYNAAKAYFTNGQAIWALLYGEQFINLEQNTARTTEIKKMMLDAYRLLFSPGADDKLPAFETSGGTQHTAKSFEAAYKNLMLRHAIVLGNGIQTETLIMLRTRFIIDWSRYYQANFPFTLFDFQEKLIQAGHFDAYNQWLFGAVDNTQAFSLWIKANADAYSAFETWLQRNPLRPAVSDPKP